MTDTPVTVAPAVVVRHNFETAHRLPRLGGKCTSLHGHSWWAELSLAADGPPPEWPEDGVLADFGPLKAGVRDWIDGRLDHGTMLGSEDPLAPILADHGTKLFLFDGEGLCDGLWWPTVENVAELLRRVTNVVLARAPWVTRELRCQQVRVQETHTNAAVVAPLAMVMAG